MKILDHIKKVNLVDSKQTVFRADPTKDVLDGKPFLRTYTRTIDKNISAVGTTFLDENTSGMFPAESFSMPTEQMVNLLDVSGKLRVDKNNLIASDGDDFEVSLYLDAGDNEPKDLIKRYGLHTTKFVLTKEIIARILAVNKVYDITMFGFDLGENECRITSSNKDNKKTSKLATVPLDGECALTGSKNLKFGVSLISVLKLLDGYDVEVWLDEMENKGQIKPVPGRFFIQDDETTLSYYVSQSGVKQAKTSDKKGEKSSDDKAGEKAEEEDPESAPEF